MANAKQSTRSSHRNSRCCLATLFEAIESLEPRQLLSTSLTPLPAPLGSTKLTGTLIGSTGSYRNRGNTIANAIDGNTATFYDAASGTGGWVGLDLGAPQTITQVQFVPRRSFASRMLGGEFQGSNTPDFSADVVTLFQITAVPAAGVYTADAVNVTGAFEFVRYLGPANTCCNIAELEFDGAPAGPPPAIPSALTALNATAVSPGDVQLSWQEDPSSIVDSFTIERQGPTDADFVVIATAPGTADSFSDPGVLPATSYLYEVIANNISGPAPMVPAASVTTPPAPVDPWSDSDIGPVGLPGSAVSYDGGQTIAVSGAGADIWNQTDAFNFASQSLVGNGTLIAQVTNESNPASWAKSGLMIRESSDPDSRYVLLALTPDYGVIMQARTATHVTPTFSVTTPASAGVWLKLVRLGSTFNGYVSTDGNSWNLLGNVSITMPNNVAAGLAVTAHDDAALCTANFANVSLVATGTDASVWTAGATAPLPRWEPASITYNNQLYVFGGFIDRSLDATAECDVYDPATNTWSYLTSVPVGGLTHAAATLVGDTVYLAGGNIGPFTNYYASVTTAQVLTYNLTTGAWGSAPSLPVATTSGGMVDINNHLIYYGGINAGSTADLSATWSLDLSNPNARWVREAAMPDARNHIGYVQIDGIAYAVGGEHLYNQTHGNDSAVDAYNPVTNQWTALASLPFPWSGIHGTTIVANGKIVIVGGQTNGGYDGIYLNNIDEYDPVTNQWANVGTLPEANQGEAVACIDGQLIASGGTVDNLGGWATDQTWLDSAIEL